MRRSWLFIIIIAAAIGGVFWWQTAARGETNSASLVPFVADDSSEQFARATIPDNIEFPRDLGPHNDYQTEWWYYTGNLNDADGRQFGFQFTIFRRALAPELVESDSDWRTNQLYFAHFTISDIENEAFYPAERFSRGAADLAGAQAAPYRVWLEDWVAEEIAPGQVRILAETDETMLDIVLTETLPPVLHGDGGLSAKGADEGNASYYYSIVRQRVDGTVRVGDELIDVTGQAWKDHEYSTSILEDDTVGWDWFSLQLDDGSSLMFFHIRNEDGTLSDFSSGSFIDPDGNVTALALDDWDLEVMDEWTSDVSGGEYPVAWRLTVPSLDLTLEGAALMENQELNVSTVYWEGAVSFSGTRAGAPISALGYVEMTGYGGSIRGRL